MQAVLVHGAGARRGRGHGGGGPLGNPISPGRGALRGFFLPFFFFLMIYPKPSKAVGLFMYTTHTCWLL